MGDAAKPKEGWLSAGGGGRPDSILVTAVAALVFSRWGSSQVGVPHLAFANRETKP